MSEKPGTSSCVYYIILQSSASTNPFHPFPSFSSAVAESEPVQKNTGELQDRDLTLGILGSPRIIPVATCRNYSQSRDPIDFLFLSSLNLPPGSPTLSPTVETITTLPRLAESGRDLTTAIYPALALRRLATRTPRDQRFQFNTKASTDHCTEEN